MGKTNRTTQGRVKTGLFLLRKMIVYAGLFIGTLLAGLIALYILVVISANRSFRDFNGPFANPNYHSYIMLRNVTLLPGADFSGASAAFQAWALEEGYRTRTGPGLNGCDRVVAIKGNVQIVSLCSSRSRAGQQFNHAEMDFSLHWATAKADEAHLDATRDQIAGLVMPFGTQRRWSAAPGTLPVR
jgi:hypothetical protein